MKGCAGNLECGERERGNVLPVQCGRAGLARCQPGHCAHEEAVCGQREREIQTCLWGVSEADWQKSFSLHLHVKWPGSDTAGAWKAAGENEGRFPG